MPYIKTVPPSEASGKVKEVYESGSGPSATEKVAAVVRNAENGCYVMQTILQLTPVERQFTLNGSPFDPDEFPRKQR